LRYLPIKPEGGRALSDQIRPQFSAKAHELAGVQDVLMCYQLVLGRDPESAFVIEEARTQPVEALLIAYAASEEFATQVAAPLAIGGRLPHEAWSRGPRGQHVAWLLDHLVPTPSQGTQLQYAKTWPVFLSVLSAIMNGISSDMTAVAAPADSSGSAYSAQELAALRDSVSALEAGLAEVQRQVADLQSFLTARPADPAAGASE
jgi:hypothetical protein